MANNATDALEEAILTGILDTASNAFSVTDGTLKLQLHGGTIPDAAGIETGGTIANELASTGGYESEPLTTTNMEVDTTGGVTKLRNKTEITFGEASANYSAQVTYIVIVGNLGSGVTSLFIGPLAEAKTVSDGDTFKFAINALEITLA